MEAELIEVKYRKYSKRGREIKYYAPVKRAIVLMPEKTKSGVIAFLKEIIIATMIIILSIPAGLSLQQAWISLAYGDHEIVVPPAESVLWMWFLTGVVFALFVYTLIDSVLDFERKRIRKTKLIVVAAIFFALFSALSVVVGVFYLLDPPYRYVQKLPILGHLALLVGMLSLAATYLLWKARRIGGYLGFLSFIIAFLVNVYVGEHPLLHAVAGAIVGLVLLLPLAISWKNLKH
jgi:uncharacterized membrane protein YqjE